MGWGPSEEEEEFYFCVRQPNEEELDPDLSQRKSVEGLEARGNISDHCYEFSKTIIYTFILGL